MRCLATAEYSLHAGNWSRQDCANHERNTEVTQRWKTRLSCGLAASPATVYSNFSSTFCSHEQACVCELYLPTGFQACITLLWSSIGCFRCAYGCESLLLMAVVVFFVPLSLKLLCVVYSPCFSVLHSPLALAYLLSSSLLVSWFALLCACYLVYILTSVANEELLQENLAIFLLLENYWRTFKYTTHPSVSRFAFVNFPSTLLTQFRN